MAYNDTIKVNDNGKIVKAARHSGGAFSSVYLGPDDSIYVKTNDPMKSMMVMLSGIPHLPQVEYIGSNVYKMPKYTTVSELRRGDLDKKAQRVLKLQEILSEAQSSVGRMPEDWNQFLKTVEKKLPKRIYDAIVTIMEASKTLFPKARMGLDFHTGNIAMDDKGKLIILDPIALWTSYDWAGN
jgi:hypothetical protein